MLQDIQVVTAGGDAAKLYSGSSVKIKGIIRASPGYEQCLELEAKKIDIIGAADNFPIQKKFHNHELFRSVYPHLRFRTSHAAVLMKFRSAFVAALTQYLTVDCGITQIHAPVLTCNDCEGGGEQFQIAGSNKWFSKDVNLTVSSQLHLEACMMGLGNVWSLGPIFRADTSNTTKHLAEFWMLEVELAFSHVSEVISFVEKMIKDVTARLIKQKWPEILYRSLKHQRESRLESSPLSIQDRWASVTSSLAWKKITFSEAANDVMKNDTDRIKEDLYENGLSSNDEKFLARNGPIFITNYPIKLNLFICYNLKII